LNCKGDFPNESATITHKAKLEQAKAEITPKKKLFHTIIILLFSGSDLQVVVKLIAQLV